MEYSVSLLLLSTLTFEFRTYILLEFTVCHLIKALHQNLFHHVLRAEFLRISYN